MLGESPTWSGGVGGRGTHCSVCRVDPVPAQHGLFRHFFMVGPLTPLGYRGLSGWILEPMGLWGRIVREVGGRRVPINECHPRAHPVSVPWVTERISQVESPPK